MQEANENKLVSYSGDEQSFYEVQDVDSRRFTVQMDHVTEVRVRATTLLLATDGVTIQAAVQTKTRVQTVLKS